MKTRALVTGASRGLGLAITAKLASQEIEVIATARKLSPELSRLIEERKNIQFVPFDLKETNRISMFCQDIRKIYGNIDFLINNAAIGNDGVLSTMHESQIFEMISINLTATILLTKYLSRQMMVQGKGKIVNVSSIIASTGFSGLSVYAASKAGLIGFTKSLARELGKKGITVNAVAPGYMATDMTAGISDEKLSTISRRSPLNRLVTVQEVAAAIGYLVSPEADGVTGTIITVDAGSTA